jgi:antitoxin component YwqK of YwqJK toxin-antitoxin module
MGASNSRYATMTELGNRDCIAKPVTQATSATQADSNNLVDLSDLASTITNTSTATATTTKTYTDNEWKVEETYINDKLCKKIKYRKDIVEMQEYLDGERHGKYIHISKGKKHTCNFRNGKLDGEEYSIRPDGQFIKINTVKGKLCGDVSAILSWKIIDEIKSASMWVYDICNGRFIKEMHDGKIHQDDLFHINFSYDNDSKISGKVTIRCSHSSTLIECVNDVNHGKYRHNKIVDGKEIVYYDGIAVNGIDDGPEYIRSHNHTYWSNDGNKHANVECFQNYKNGKLDGMQTYKIDGKAFLEIEYKDGLTHGRYLQHRSDKLGTPRYEAEFKDGKLNGNIVEYEMNNNKRLDYYKENDKLHGTLKEYKNGILIRHSLYADDRQNGVCKSYYNSGHLYQVVEYKDGKANGKYTEYYKNGLKKIEQMYENGKIHGMRKEWTITGRLKRHSIYDNGNEDSVVYKE